MKLFKSIKPRKDGINSDIRKLQKGASDMQSMIVGFGKELRELPWNKLPVQGWVCIIIMLAIILLLSIFVVPEINQF